jgi:hypothetical protein
VSTASAAATEALSLSLREALRLVEALAARLDASLEGTSPSRVALGSALAAAFGFRVASMLLDARRAVRRRGLLFVLFALLKRMPVVRGAVAREKRKLIDEMDADMTAKSLGGRRAREARVFAPERPPGSVGAARGRAPGGEGRDVASE